jgi:hypothetical protein
MTSNSDSQPLPRDELVAYLAGAFEGVDVTTALNAWFFSADPDTHWPNFATIVTTDEHDMDVNSDLTRRKAYRLNIGVSPQTFKRLIDDTKQYDYTATDVIVPHPVYARQRWIAIVNPSRQTFEDLLRPLLDEAFAKVARTAPPAQVT